jgi:undecaprenyl-diphosphatase
MIIASSFFGISDDFTKLFTIVIQLGAILCSCFIFQTFLSDLGLYFKLFVAFIPAVVLGLLFSDLIDELQSPVTVAVSLWWYCFIKS